jgi:DNA-directed RNA polymerase specialized sigma24 family protein
MPGERQDYRQLIESHQRRLVGWFRMRVGDPDVAADLTQRTWVDVLERIHTFDPQRGNFWTFTKIWAQFVLRQYYSEGKHLWLHAHPADDDADAEPDGQPAVWSRATEAGGSPDIEEVLQSSALLIDLVQQVLRCRRLPHEVIAFGYVKLLEWKPTRVADELSDIDLQRLAERLQDEYLRCVPRSEVRAAFGPLRESLSGRVGACDVDPRVKERYRDLADRIAGTTLLRDYYPPTGTREEAVTRWWASVSRVAKEDLLRLSTGPVAESLRARRMGSRARGAGS